MIERQAAAVAPMRVTTILAVALTAAVTIAAAAEHHEISSRRAAERKAFTDAEITDGFFRTAFGAELHIAGAVNRIRKFEMPVRVHVDNRARPDRRDQLAAVVNDIGRRIQHLDIAMAESPVVGNMTATLVHDRDLPHTVNQIYGRQRARLIRRSLVPQCLSSFRKDENFRIVHSQAIIVADAGDFVFYDCAYEELLQALGPINDTNAVPWTMFNDHVHMGFFDIYDQYLLNILYDPRIRAGMKPDEVRALLPQVLPTVRSWIARVNNLGP
jgi:Protein of unknown function (DUF2927)